MIIVLLALAGFLAGGVYSTWKTAKGLAMLLAVGLVLAVGGAAAWWFSL
ncbi:hypothetical protein [Haloechinothrix sp. LS1_15]|nr:hypothetical protein [Haloechinothrix sp. LS1_15]